MVPALYAEQKAGESAAEGHQKGRLLPGAGEDAAIHSAGIVDEIGPDHKGPHGVPHEEVGETGKPLPRQLPKGVGVVNQIGPAVLLAQKAVFPAPTGGFPVAQMIMAHHGETVIRQIGGKAVVPAHMF